MANSTQKAADDLQGSWASYTVKTVKNIGSFFASHIQKCSIGCAHALANLFLNVSACCAAVTLKELSGSKHEFPYDGTISTLVVVMSGIVEEIFFRGVLQNGIYSISSFVFNKLNINNHENKAFWTAVIPTASAFSSLHLLLPKPSLIQTAQCFASGLHYGYVSHNYGLETAIWLHASHNFALGIGINNIIISLERMTLKNQAGV